MGSTVSELGFAVSALGFAVSGLGFVALVLGMGRAKTRLRGNAQGGQASIHNKIRKSIAGQKHVQK